LENVAIVPDWQYEYGAGDKGKKPLTQSEAVSTGRWSWGAKMDGSDVIQFDGVKRPYSPQKIISVISTEQEIHLPIRLLYLVELKKLQDVYRFLIWITKYYSECGF
jgi:hypothetical protein